MNELLKFLDSCVIYYNQSSFIKNDPVSIPHLFSKKEDIEIAGFLTALISWGNRTAIIKSAAQLMNWMDGSPFDFVLNASEPELKLISSFYYRTFQGDDLLFVLYALRNIWEKKEGLEVLAAGAFRRNGKIKEAIVEIRKTMLEIPHLKRSEKHLANPENGSAAKRTNMFLRWMVRNDGAGVDFGLWKNIPQSLLMCPLDVHSGTTARKLGLLSRKQNDWKAVEELTLNLKKFDPQDPVKYDFALFGLGVSRQFASLKKLTKSYL